MSEPGLLAAVHEAGHVTAWLATGRRVQSARVDEHGAGLVRPLLRRTRDRGLLARAALAGPVAEAEYRNVAPARVVEEPDSAADRAAACRYLDLPAVPPAVLDEVRLMISAHWRLVWTVALELHARGRLGYRRLEGLRRLHVPGQVWL